MRLLFSLTKSDFDIDTFRCPGKGGQNVNKVESGVRITHRASGAVAKSCEERHQHQNRKIAFERLTQTLKFRQWHRAEVSRRLGQRSIDDIVDEAMKPENLLIETY